MNYAKLMKGARKRIPLILSLAASAGVVATTVVALKIRPKEPPEDSSPQEQAAIYLRTYGPTIVLAGSTIACILGSYALTKKQQAVLTSAYTMLYTSYAEYKAKVKELYGEETHKTIMESIGKEKCKDVEPTAFYCGRGASLGINDSTNPEVVRTFYDYISDRHFESTLSKVIAAEYHLNRNFVLGAFVTLNDFYEFLGLSPTEHGANVGWYLDDGVYWIDFDHQLITLDDSPDGMEVCAIEPIVEPRLESEYDL